VRLAEAPSYGLPGVLFDPSARGSQAFVAFAQEMIQKMPTAQPTQAAPTPAAPPPVPDAVPASADGMPPAAVEPPPAQPETSRE